MLTIYPKVVEWILVSFKFIFRFVFESSEAAVRIQNEPSRSPVLDVFSYS